MAAITKETDENNGIEVIKYNFNNLWLNERHVGKQLGLRNLPALTNKYVKNIMDIKNIKNKDIN